MRVCACVSACVICAGWMRVSALLYVAKREFFAREISDVSPRFYPKVKLRKNVRKKPVRVMFLLFSSPFTNDVTRSWLPRTFITFFVFFSYASGAVSLPGRRVLSLSLLVVPLFSRLASFTPSHGGFPLRFVIVSKLIHRLVPLR